jgi:tRNA 2-thiouridine synthesizing protein B
MLHLIYQSPLEQATLQRIAESDSLLFMENAILRLLKTAAQATELTTMTVTHSLFVLASEIQLRGIYADELVKGIDIINYQDFVRLTLRHQLIYTWN